MNMIFRNRMIILYVSIALLSSSYAQTNPNLGNSIQQIKNQILLKSNSSNYGDYSLASETTGYTERLTEKWDGINWVPIRRSLYSYNSNNSVSEIIVQEWMNSDWSSKFRDTYQYQDNLLMEILSQDWNGTQWLDAYKRLYNYDEYGYQISYTALAFNNEWLTSLKYDYYLDNSTHLIDSMLIQTGQDADLINNANYVWVRNNQLKDSIVYNYWWKKDGWENGYKHSYSYPDASQSYVLMHEKWNTVAYVSSSREYSYYDENGGILNYYTQYWDGKWRNESKQIASYDDQGKIIEMLDQVSDHIGFVWFTNSRDLYSYNSDDQLVTRIHQIGDGTNWVDEDRYSYSYGTASDVADKTSINNFILHNNYPNPFNPTTTIRYSVPERCQVCLKVFDILGNEVATLVNEEKEGGSYSIEFSGNSLVSGIYVYRLITSNFVESKKMLLLK